MRALGKAGKGREGGRGGFAVRRVGGDGVLGKAVRKGGL